MNQCLEHAAHEMQLLYTVGYLSQVQNASKLYFRHTASSIQTVKIVRKHKHIVWAKLKGFKC